MCGITVYITKNNDIIKTSNMMKVLHRGPDSANMIETEYKDYTLSFVFHRLAIIDLDNGSQPFKFEDDNRIVYLVCNGEIYNYLDIINIILKLNRIVMLFLICFYLLVYLEHVKN